MKQPPEPIVNFMIVGAQKCGTTALWSYLREHRDVCMAWGREVHLFDLMDTSHVRRDRIDRFYAGYFAHYAGEALRGESTPAYLYHPTALAEIRRYNPDMKIIVLLRDPVERALSHYAMEREQGHERWPLSLALLLEGPRLWWLRYSSAAPIQRMFHAYIGRGRYQRQIRKLRALFPPEQILVLDSRALLAEPADTLERVYRFLGLTQPVPLPRPRRKFVTQQKVHPGGIARFWLRLCLGRERRRYLSGVYEES